MIVKYDDNTWHRGLVLNKTPDGLLKVLYVDFGEILFMDPKQNCCHKELLFQDVPIQASERPKPRF